MASKDAFNVPIDNEFLVRYSPNKVEPHIKSSPSGKKAAREQERALIKATGRGSRDWKDHELKLIRNGNWPTGYHAHHINNLKHHPHLRGDPRNFIFLTRDEHMKAYQGHRGVSTKLPTDGRLIDRERTIERHVKNVNNPSYSPESLSRRAKIAELTNKYREAANHSATRSSSQLSAQQRPLGGIHLSPLMAINPSMVAPQLRSSDPMQVTTDVDLTLAAAIDAQECVRFDPSAPLLGAGVILKGAVADAANGKVYLLGQRSVVTPHLLGLSLMDVYVAVRAAIANEALRFSLDPADPLDPSGAELRKVYLPEALLRGTTTGEKLFEADWLLKEASFGVLQHDVPQLVDQKELHFRKLFEARNDRATENHTYSRLWIRVVSCDATCASDLLVWNQVRMGVSACRQEPDPTSPSGLRDVETPPGASETVFAESFTANYDLMSEEHPEFGEVKEIAKGLQLAHWLIASGYTRATDINYAHLSAEPEMQLETAETLLTSIEPVETLHASHELPGITGTCVSHLTGGVDMTVPPATSAPLSKAHEGLRNAVLTEAKRHKPREMFSVVGPDSMVYICMELPLGRSYEAPDGTLRRILQLRQHGNEYYKRGDLTAALCEYDKLVAQAAFWPTAFYNRAQVLGMLGRFDAALADATHAVQLAPSVPKYNARRAKLLVESASLEQLQQLAATGDDAARPLAQTILSRRKPEEAKLALSNGVKHLKAGQFSQALEALTRAAELDVNNWLVYINRSSAHYYVHEYSAAMSDAGKAIWLTRDSPAVSWKPYVQMSYALEGLGKVKEACDLLVDSVLKRDAFMRCENWESTLSQVALNACADGRRHFKAGKHEEAWSDFTRALGQCNPAVAPVACAMLRCNRAAAAMKLGLVCRGHAERDIDAAMQLHRHGAKPYIRRAELMIACNEHPQALAVLRTAVDACKPA